MKTSQALFGAIRGEQYGCELGLVAELRQEHGTEDYD